jgi:CubicO group peptidase (beta-lactamase class C family)
MRRLLAIIALAGCACAQQIEWSGETPERHGFDGAKLRAWTERLAERGTRALLIVRDGKIIHEWYAANAGPDVLYGTASLAKAIVGGMSLLVALNDGRISLDDPASKYIPAWRDDPRKSKITIRHLATHTSGIEDAEEAGKPHDQLTGWKGDFWKRKPDPISIAIHRAPAIFNPGERFHYSNTGMAALGYAVTAALGKDLKSTLKERVLDPLGVPASQLDISYGETYDVDGLKVHANWGGGRFTARATARIGQLMLQRGAWNGRQLLDSKLVTRVVSYAPVAAPDRAAQMDPAISWWTNHLGRWRNVPRDAFAGAGAGHQVMLVVPSLNLIVVRYGTAFDESRDLFWSALESNFGTPLMDTFRAPYPQSQVIRGVRFAPEETIVRKAIDSDNWPVTWADDGDLYTSYGDGRGFEPGVERKLSMGFARIAGDPPNFRPENVRSPTGERTGDGAKGAKSSGMLMVDGILYMWVRNTGNSQLAWSTDRGRSWEWGFRFDTSFGSPVFLNFGRNYAGARDDYVYVYSQDGPSAYASDDRLVLARAPRNKLRERTAWEFLARLDASRKPVWTADITARGGVFEFPGHCQRVDAVYNAGLKRYLLAVGYNHAGGWGIYDAPEPWGPWSTAFHTEYWGLGGTHGYRLPSKWIGADGRTMHLIFSGVRLAEINNDAFCVRGMTIE